MMEPVLHSVIVSDKIRFLRAMMAALSDRGRMSLEGNLSRCRFPLSCVVSHGRVGVLRRNTLFPRQLFIVVALDLAEIDPILAQVTAAGLEIEDDGVKHVLIEQDGILQLGAYDNFDKDCVVTGPDVPPDLLTEMQDAGVICSFEVAKYRGEWPGMKRSPP